MKNWLIGGLLFSFVYLFIEIAWRVSAAIGISEKATWESGQIVYVSHSFLPSILGLVSTVINLPVIIVSNFFGLKFDSLISARVFIVDWGEIGILKIPVAIFSFILWFIFGAFIFLLASKIWYLLLFVYNKVSD